MPQRPLPQPSGPLTASPSAFDLFRDAQSNVALFSDPPPVPPKPPTPGPLPVSSAAVLSRAEEIMRQGSPSRRRRRPATPHTPPPPPGSRTPAMHSTHDINALTNASNDKHRIYPRPLPVPVPRGATNGQHDDPSSCPKAPTSPTIPPLMPPQTRPPIPVIMIDGEVMTDDMMDPMAPDPEANMATSDEAPAPQHASSSSAAEREMWQGSRVSEGITAVCHRCSRWIGGAMVHAMGHAWHARCFTCAHCGMPLEHVSFYEHDGQPYCHLDFHELFSRRCYHCQTPIVEERFVTVDAFGESRAYHELHFFCASCGDPFVEPKDADDTSGSEGSRPFFVHGRHAYCESCYHRLYRPKCHACHQPVEEEHIAALRAVWHRECFVCTRCRKPCLGAVFAAPDGSPCDFDCYQAWIRGGTSGPAPPAPPAFIH
ncbi:hypothetical protein MEQU1_003144 [Malassezia equina]|uniref:LIM zinc-binding domain-containing protein n=1 Tax=Malassezia equina TaxID=1381935 RepID=A0AAF0J1G0_9BASI|nr:hypothetical protein MEQU1_003144 [Malassezia equina]